jgi:hypothetical protein
MTNPPVVSSPPMPSFLQKPWGLIYTNSRRSFQYIDQLDHARTTPPTLPAPPFYESDPLLYGPYDLDELARHDSTRIVRPPDFTQVPLRWSKTLPYLAYVYRRSDDPIAPTDSCVEYNYRNLYWAKRAYFEKIDNFVRRARLDAHGWSYHMRTNGFDFQSPMIPPFSVTESGHFDLDGHTTTSYRDKSIEAIREVISYGYACRGYARWLSRKFIACLARELGMPSPHFGVDESVVGAVFRAEDLKDARILPIMKELEQDGVPVFGVLVLEPRRDAIWNRVPCAKNPVDSSMDTSSETPTVVVSVERVYAVEHPSPWFSRPRWGYPGCSNTSQEELELRNACKAVYPSARSIRFTMETYNSVAKFFGPGPFFCGRKPSLPSILLKRPDVESAKESAALRPLLEPLQQYTMSVLQELKPPQLFSPPPQDIVDKACFYLMNTLWY